jgi:hypothetical protein
MEAQDAHAVAAAITALWHDPDARDKRAAAAAAVIERGAHALEATLDALDAMLRKPAHAPA